MAEETIFIKYYEDTDCLHGYSVERTVELTRQEAIERMAKTMCHHPDESCEGCIGQKKKQTCKQVLEGVKELAEEALNALLEGNND